MRIFVAWDFTDDAAKSLLEGVAKYAATDARTWVIPGVNNPKASGVIGSDIVERQVRESDLVVAFTDKANANVGWEAGLALGLGKQVRLASLRPEPAFLRVAALSAVLVTTLASWQDIAALVEQDDWGVALPKPDATARTSCVLCAGGPEGSVLRKEVESEDLPNVVLQPPSGSKIGALTELVSGAGRVIWIVPLEPNASERDGADNVSNAVVAGAARGAGWPVTILCSKRGRNLVDVGSEATDFDGLDDFRSKLRTAVAVSAVPEVAEPFSFVAAPGKRDEPALIEELVRLFPLRGAIRQLAERVGVAVLPASTAPDQIWGDVLRQLRNRSGDIGPIVQAGLVVEPHNATLARLAARS